MLLEGALNVRADTLGGAVGQDHARSRLQRLQLLELHIELKVRHRWVILYIIFIGSPRQCSGQAGLIVDVTLVEFLKCHRRVIL